MIEYKRYREYRLEERQAVDKVLHVLQTGENEVHVDAELREKTKLPLERMLQLAK